MPHLFIQLSFLIAGYKWGDWKNWRKYYSTILFFILMDLFYNFLLYHYPMWTLHDSPIPLFQYEYFIILCLMFLRYPPTVLIYLGKFPNGRLKRMGWITLWVVIYFILEVLNLHMGSVSHHNGWNLAWSFLFNIVLFVMIKIHYHRPLLSWALSFIWILFLWNIFDVPMDVLEK
jgi:hypothetical protein